MQQNIEETYGFRLVNKNNKKKWNRILTFQTVAYFEHHQHQHLQLHTKIKLYIHSRKKKDTWLRITNSTWPQQHRISMIQMQHKIEITPAQEHRNQGARGAMIPLFTANHYNALVKALFLK